MKFGKKAIIASSLAIPLICAPFMTSAMGQQVTTETGNIVGVSGVTFQDSAENLPNPYRQPFSGTEEPEIALQNNFEHVCAVNDARRRNMPPGLIHGSSTMREQERQEREEMDIDIVEDTAENCLEERLEDRLAMGSPRTVIMDGRTQEGESFRITPSASTDAVRLRARQNLGRIGNTQIVGEARFDTENGADFVGIRVTRAAPNNQ